MAEGWMYRFEDGPVGPDTFGPTDHDPPERLIAMKVAGALVVADRDEVEEVPEGAAVYTRKSISKLPEQDQDSFVVRGAVYVVEAAKMAMENGKVVRQ